MQLRQRPCVIYVGVFKCYGFMQHARTHTHTATVAPPFNLSVVSSRKLQPSNIAECLFRANWAITLLNRNH